MTTPTAELSTLISENVDPLSTHYVESGQTASLSCWLLAATRNRVANSPFGSNPPFDSGATAVN